MNLYNKLRKYAKARTSFEKTEEFDYYLTHRHLLRKYDAFKFLVDVEDQPFMIIRANVILQGLTNLKIFDSAINSTAEALDLANKEGQIKFKSLIKEMTAYLPYKEDGKNKIFMPFFSKALNSLYSNEPIKILKYPYNQAAGHVESYIVDAFDTYGAELYDSYFTRLVKVASNDNEIAYFHYDTDTIYIVNSQGRLDEEIVLYDRFLKNPNHSHMLERIRPVVNAYFDSDRSSFIDSLFDNGFISSKLRSILQKD